MPSVSVIITYHNRSRLVEETLNSVWAQTWQPQEVIVVDDCSRPEEAVALDRVAGRARVIHLKENLGTAVARNIGIRESSGDLIALLDDDDIWLPEKLAVQLEYLEKNPQAEIIHTGVTAFFRDGREAVYINKESPLTLSPSSVEIAQIVPSTMVARREVFDKTGLYDEDMRLHEDVEFQVRCLAMGVRVEFIPQSLVRFRRLGHGNVTASKWDRHWRAHRFIFHKHEASYRAAYGENAQRKHVAYLLRYCGNKNGGLWGRTLSVAGRMVGLLS